jgi:glycosyltransferase involved in cell wall biosynthesis
MENNMNIWFFNHYAVPPAYYPLARQYNFARHLLEKGHSINIFAASTVHNSDINLIEDNRAYLKEDVDNINYVYLKTTSYKGNGLKRIINMLQYTIGLFKVTKKFSKPDIIIATTVHPLACVAGIMIAKKRKSKCIVEIADLWPLTLIEFGLINKRSLLANILYRLEHWIYKNADAIIFTMEGGKDYIVDQGWEKSVELSKIYYINNGIDLEVYNKQKSEYVLKDSDLDNEIIFKVLYTGALGQANALNYIMEAAKIIQEKGYEKIKFIIFGDGYMKVDLEQYCADNKLDNVVFKGKVDKKLIPGILNRSNLNIFTGQQFEMYKYGLSLNKMFDYMASGKPVVSNIVCGYDNLKKYQCGTTVEGRNADVLAKEILRFFEMAPVQYDRYCQNALHAAMDFDFKKLTSQLKEIIHNTIKIEV